MLLHYRLMSSLCLFHRGSEPYQVNINKGKRKKIVDMKKYSNSRNIIPLFVLVVIIVVSACGQGQNDSKQTETPVREQDKPIENNDDKPSAEPSEQPVNEQNDGQVKLNPPHGEPNHRCDIPVGSPLNSEAKNTASETTNQTKDNTTRETDNNSFAPTVENAERLKSTQTNQTSASKSGEKPDVNPPHGEPWHRCDIAVGSPL